MYNVLVTGGAGFIGSNLCERLVKEGHNVTSLDNYSTGSKENHVPGVFYINGETQNILSNENLFKADIVFHLGEYSRVEQSFGEVSKVWNSNLIGTQRVLEYVLKCNAKLIYAGSSTKFAGENMSPYAFSKTTNTKLVMNYGEWFGLKYAITYFYNVYGNREIADGHYATLIAKFIRKTRNGEPLEVVLPGTQIRNFTNIKDTINGLILVAAYGEGDGYSIGNPTAYSVKEIAEMCGQEIIYLPERKGNRMSAPQNIDKILQLGWNPIVDVRDYINGELRK